jgi:MbtH protein
MHGRPAMDQSYLVVVNHEKRYSIWPVNRALPIGWQEAGRRGSRDQCLAYVKEAWIDLRPVRIRRVMEEQARTALRQARPTG